MGPATPFNTTIWLKAYSDAVHGAETHCGIKAPHLVHLAANVAFRELKHEEVDELDWCFLGVFHLDFAFVEDAHAGQCCDYCGRIFVDRHVAQRRTECLGAAQRDRRERAVAKRRLDAAIDLLLKL